MNRYDLGQAETVLCEAMQLAVPILRRSITEGQGEQLLKDDGSLGTETDKKSEQIILSYLEKYLDIPVIGEEGGKVGAYSDNERVVFVDPQDGTTSGRMHSTTATAGACIYNPLTKEFEAATVVDPFGGRLWYTKGKKTYRQIIDVYTAQSIGKAIPVYTSRKTFEDGGEILLDNFHGFTRTDMLGNEQRKVISLQEKVDLVKALQEGCGKIRSASSNLHHQALVADGGFCHRRDHQRAWGSVGS
jgi:fructose-1,6-bisphosphatase/inositol monophosphatase family enzyme